MKFTRTFLFSLFGAAALAADEETVPLRRLRQQALHIPDLFEMAETKKAAEWYELGRLMKNRNAAQKLYEMDVFERLLQSDSMSLSFSMPPTAPTPVVPTPIMTPPVKAPIMMPPVKAPLPMPPAKAPLPMPPVKAPLPMPPAKAPLPMPPVKAPGGIPPTVVVVPTPVTVPVDYSCPSYPACAAMGLVGDCCPTRDGVFLDCCTATPPVMAPTIIVTPPVAPTVIVTPPVAPVPVFSPPVAPTAVAPVPGSPVAAPKSKTGSMSMSPSSPGVVSPVGEPTSKSMGRRQA
jgi:hypothetical protein